MRSLCVLNLVSARPCTLTNGGITLAVQVKSSPEGQPQRLLDFFPSAFKCGKLLPHSKTEIWARKPHATSSPWNLQKASRGPLSRGPTFEVLWIHRTKSVPFMNIAWPRLNSVTGIRFPEPKEWLCSSVDMSVSPWLLFLTEKRWGREEIQAIPTKLQACAPCELQRMTDCMMVSVDNLTLPESPGKGLSEDRLSRSGWSMDDCLS